jgi:hypothetical protein
VLGILRLKLAATVVIVGPRVVHYFIGLVWLVTFVSLIIC